MGYKEDSLVDDRYFYGVYSPPVEPTEADRRRMRTAETRQFVGAIVLISTIMIGLVQLGYLIGRYWH